MSASTSEKDYSPIPCLYRNATGLDLYLPPFPSPNMPIITSIHGGGLVGGSHKPGIKMPYWLIEKCHARGWAFVSAGYSFIPANTAFDILEDVKALLSFLVAPDGLGKVLPENSSIDPLRIGLVGSSAGCYLARLAAVHADPKPCVNGLLWGMAVPLNDHWLKPAHPAFFTRFPNAPPLAGPIPDWMAEGIYYDKFTGAEIANVLRALPVEDRVAALDSKYRPLFPEFQVEKYPPTFFVHGKQDSLVLPEESINTYESLKNLGIPTDIRLVEGAEHSLRSITDLSKYVLVPETEQCYEDMFEFMEKHIKQGRVAG